MSQSNFALSREISIPSLNIQFQEYCHQATGARHLHMVSDDDNNAFMVAFRTVPTDSSGVAHILEHTSLCGSKRYPVRDPFFMMYRRSLNTFMNAFTACDWTAYPFASQSAKDFDNLLQVYLDAVFFPNLDKLDFAQEGYRLEFAEMDNPDSELLYKGVVFNEMKGAMSSPERRVWQSLQSALFVNNTYHFNSGGEPLKIPDLSYQQLKDFHARFYHPSNSLFMTYGNLSVESHQERFEGLALCQFDRLEIDTRIDDARRFHQPAHLQTSYALDGDDDAKEKTHIVMGWLLGPVSDLETHFDAQVMSSVLLDNSASPLRQALETSTLGTAPSDLCGLDDEFKEAIFVCGLEGSESDRTEAVEELVLQTLQTVASEGVPQKNIESVLHQLELGQREIGGGHFPYGLQLMLRGLTQALHGGDPVTAIDIDPVLSRLRRKIEKPNYLQDLVCELLLDNPHRVLLTVSPDAEGNRKEVESEKKKLAMIRASLDAASCRDVVDLAKALKDHQESPENAEVLPRVTLQDVPADLAIPQTLNTNGLLHLDQYAAITNGLFYQQVVVPMPSLDDALIQDLPLFCECLSEVGCADSDYLQIQQRQSAVSGGISAGLSMRDIFGNKGAPGLFFNLQGKALLRNHAAFNELLREMFFSARFDETGRLRELVAQMRAEREASVTDQGHSLAMIAAAAGFSATGQLNHQWNGLSFIQSLIRLDRALDDKQVLLDLSRRLTAIQDVIINAPRRFLLIGEEDALPSLAEEMRQLWVADDVMSAGSGFACEFEALPEQQAWVTSTQVNFCARAYATVAADHPDAPALSILGYFLRNGFLHRRIREQGGAYGGGASYSGNDGVFRFYSYRDPRLLETLADFDASLDWLQNEAHEDRLLEEAILGAISDIDRPGSPATRAATTYFSTLHGRNPDFRRNYRQQILAVQLEDLIRVAAAYLQPQTARTAVVTDNSRWEDFLRDHESAFQRFDLDNGKGSIAA